MALCEGWANYIQWKVSSSSLGHNSMRSGYPYTYIYMFDSLNSIGCSFSDMEKCLTSRSITGYRDLLINNYPSLNTKITNITKLYE